jgi:LacI family transcriptional regulator, repressor for deo operon, udp, cdd, tsx, nupC, and nupG
MARIRLQDVAARTGVSEATISRVMNGKPGVSERTRADVLSTLAALGYEPPELRRERKVGLVGLIVPELDNPIFPLYAQAIEGRLASQSYTALLCCNGRVGASEEAHIATLLDHGVAGIIVLSGAHADTLGQHRMYRELIDRKVPLVFINGHVDGLDVPSASADDHHAALIAVEHLADLGHRRVGFLAGSSSFVPVRRKLAGYREAVERRGLATDPELVVECLFTVEGGHSGGQRLIAAGATGIIAASDMMALGCVRAVQERGLTVGADVSVVGYDDNHIMAFTNPPLTTVRQPVLAISDHAVRLLLAQISGGHFDAGEHLARPDLIVRASTGQRPKKRR